MEKIRITISKDELKAFLTIPIKGALFPSREEILFGLRTAGIKQGVKLETLDEIARRKEPVYEALIAEGKPPVKGKDAQIVWEIPLKGRGDATKAQKDETARIDFKKALHFVPVQKHQVLARKIPAESGQNGLTVTGKEIPSWGRDIALPAGKNTEISEDGLELRAAITGSAYLQNGKVHVDKVLHIKGDVNYGTGNIKFTGPVIIEGDVRSGFKVEARDSIVINGNVEAAHIYSQQGDVTVKYGVVGKKRAKILAAGNFTCGFVQDATVGVRGDVMVSHYLINCNVSAGGRVIVKGKEGQIRGGSITSEKGIHAVTVGSDRNIYTELKIFSLAQNSSQKKLWELSRMRTDMALRLSTLEKRLKFLEIIKKQVKTISEEKIAEMKFIANEIKRLKARLMQLDDEEIVLQKEAAKERMLKEVVVEGSLFPNVHIDINGLGFHSDETLRSVKIYRFKDELIVESLKGTEDLNYDIFVPGSKT